MDFEFLAKIVTNMLALLFSLAFHEFAHAAVATVLGDRTAKAEGRLSLNPVVHADPWGTIAIPLIGSVLGGALIGWAKPVPVNQNALRWRKTGLILVSFAGPLSNLLLSAISFVLILILDANFPQYFVEGSAGIGVMRLLQAMFFLNPFLAFFNLIPLPPLDGGQIMREFLPYRAAIWYDTYITPYGFMFLLGIMLSGGLGWISTLIQWWLVALKGLAAFAGYYV